MAEKPDPIVINRSATGAMIAAGVRVVIVLLSGLAAVLGFIGHRDLAGLVGYLQSESFVPVAAAIVAVGTFLASQWSTWRKHRDAVTTGDAAPNKVAVVVGSPPPA